MYLLWNQKRENRDKLLKKVEEVYKENFNMIPRGDLNRKIYAILKKEYLVERCQFFPKNIVLRTFK